MIGKLITHQLMRQEPAEEDTCKESSHGKHYLSCKEIEHVEQRTAKTVSKSYPPKDIEHTRPIIEQATVTIVAARLRLSLHSSSKNTVLASCMEIMDVRAAKASNA